MENIIDRPGALITEFLVQIKSDLLHGRMSASEAGLAASRLIRIFVSDAQVAPITRELLGYSDDEAATELQLLQRLTGEITTCARPLARHRLIRGFRLQLFATMRHIQEKTRPAVKRDQWFCGMSACEVEALVEQLDASGAPYVVLDCNDEDNRVFICNANDLRLMEQGMRELIAWFIDVLLMQLRQKPTVTEQTA